MADHPPLKFAAIGLDHRHIYHQVGRLLELGAECKGYYSARRRGAARGLRQALPRADAGRRPARPARGPRDPADRHAPAIPGERAGDRDPGDAPRQGRDGRQAGRDHGRRSSTRSGRSQAGDRADLVGQLLRALRGQGDDPGAGAGRGGRARPRGADRGLRPAPAQPPPAPGLVLRAGPGAAASSPTSPRTRSTSSWCFTGSEDAEIVASAVANHANPESPAFEDFGEILLRSEHASGYIRVDWYTPDGLPTWGDGRCTILGTEGYIELRKYVDIAGRDGHRPPVPGRPRGHPPHRLQHGALALLRAPDRRRPRAHRDRDAPGALLQGLRARAQGAGRGRRGSAERRSLPGAVRRAICA